MEPRNRLVQIISAVVLVLGLGVSGLLATSMSAEAGRAQLSYTDQATEADPPEVALGVAMGAFRGMFVNYLWLRANRLKDEGKFYEAIELSNAITRLQPRFPRVWTFHAWNMSYNISVATNTAEERWQWVRAGIDILRDEGIPRNPNEVLLYKELAWIFIHKIQGFQDDANHYYKKALAREWQTILGEPPELPDFNEPEAIRLMVDWLQPIVDAPETIEGVIERERLGRTDEAEPGAVDSIVEELVARLDEIGLEPGEELLRLSAVSLTLRESLEEAAELQGVPEQVRASLRRTLRDNSRLNTQLDELVNDERYRDAWDRLIPHIRKRVLIDEYNMSPALMQQYTEVYGPLDWRHAASHAAYWSTLGVDRALTRQSTTQFNTLNTDRIIVQSLQELFRTGDVHYDLLADTHFTMYNLHYADKYGKVLEELAKRAGRSQDRSKRIFTTYGQGYTNFVANVARLMYQLGQRAEAERYFRIYRTSEWINLNDYFVDVYASMSLDEFIADLINREGATRLSIPYVAVSEVTTSLRMALIKGLLEGDRDVFLSNIQYARAVHARYFQEQDVTTMADPERNRMDEMPVEFAGVLSQVFFEMLTSGDLSPLDDAPLLYDRAPLFLRQLVYDSLVRTLSQRGYTRETFDELYPEPPGMENFRANMRSSIEALQRDDKAKIRFETQ